jgi:hypothetical protein
MKNNILLCLMGIIIALPSVSLAKKKVLTLDDAKIDGIKVKKGIFRGKTKLERFFSKSGILLIKEYYVAGRIKQFKNKPVNYLRFISLFLYLPGQPNSVVKGIKIDVVKRKNGSLEDSIFIDAPEIESLYKAINYIAKTSKKLKKRVKNIDVIYETKGNFRIALLQRFKTKNKIKKVYQRFFLFLRTKTLIGHTIYGFEFYNVKMFKNSLKPIIQKAVKTLNKYHKKTKSNPKLNIF